MTVSVDSNKAFYDTTTTTTAVKTILLGQQNCFWAPQSINFITHNSIVPVPVSGYIISVQEVSVQNKC